jgi:hypothetical protein
MVIKLCWFSVYFVVDKLNNNTGAYLLFVHDFYKSIINVTICSEWKNCEIS